MSCMTHLRPLVEAFSPEHKAQIQSAIRAFDQELALGRPLH